MITQDLRAGHSFAANSSPGQSPSSATPASPKPASYAVPAKMHVQNLPFASVPELTSLPKLLSMKPSARDAANAPVCARVMPSS